MTITRTVRISRLLSRLSRRFDVLTEAVPVGPLRVQLTRVRDPQKVLDDLCEKIDVYEKTTGRRVAGDQLGLPYWAELWDSAIGVGQWAVNSEQWAVGRKKDQSAFPPTAHRAPPTVLDLGCGMGLAGTVAAMLGAKVLFADIERDCLLFALLNGLRYSNDVSARRVDWQKDNLGLRFDLIIGSDVLYDKTQWVFLEPFFRAHLSPGGRVILGEPGRMSGELFLPWITERGWSLQQHAETVPTRSTPIKLFELRCSV
jgi:2-polyprenyl-3-methyl-5-hydroxy-6-metoxy-1,4-benzoquinol methylase